MYCILKFTLLICVTTKGIPWAIFNFSQIHYLTSSLETSVYPTVWISSGNSTEQLIQLFCFVHESQQEDFGKVVLEEGQGLGKKYMCKLKKRKRR